MTTLLLSSSSGKALFAPQTGGGFVILRPIEDRTGGGAEGDLFRQDVSSRRVRDRFALSRAAASPGLAALAGG